MNQEKFVKVFAIIAASIPIYIIKRHYSKKFEKENEEFNKKIEDDAEKIAKDAFKVPEFKINL